MKKRQKLLTDEQWELVEPMLPPPRRRRDNRGRPWASNRACFEGILWILQTGAAWRFLPDEFPSPSTCWRRLKQWEDAVGKTKRGKGTKWMVLVDGQGLPLGVRLESASPHEVTLAEATLQKGKRKRR